MRIISVDSVIRTTCEYFNHNQDKLKRLQDLLHINEGEMLVRKVAVFLAYERFDVSYEELVELAGLCGILTRDSIAKDIATISDAHGNEHAVEIIKEIWDYVKDNSDASEEVKLLEDLDKQIEEIRRSKK